MKKLARGISLAAAVLLLATCFAGCKTTTKTAGGGGTDKSQLYEIKYLCTPNGFSKSDETPVGKFIKDKFNIVFEFIPYSGNIKEKQSLMLAGGDYNELQLLQGDDMVKNYLGAGALLNIDNYKNSMPDFYERYKEQIPYWRLISDDGGLYKYETKIPLKYSSDYGIFDMAVRSDALEAQGWPTLVSTDDWFNFLMKAKQQMPETNGKKTTGVTAPFAESFGLSGISQILYEKGDTYMEVSDYSTVYNYKTGKFEDTFKNKYVKESLAFLNKLHRNGLLDEECFTDTADKTKEKLSQGTPLAVWYTSWYITQPNQELKKAGNEKMTYIYMPIQAASQYNEGQKRIARTETTRAFNAHAITKNAKYPERLAELVNWAASDDGQCVIRSGVEGDMWTKDETGKRVPTEEGKKLMNDSKAKTAKGINLFYGILPSFNLTAKDGQYHDLFSEQWVKDLSTQTSRTLEAYKNLGWKSKNTWYEKNAFFGETGLASSITLDSTTDFGKASQKMIECRVKYTPKLILANSEEEFEKLYAQALAEYDKLNPQSVIDEYNRMLDEQAQKLAKYQK